MVSWLPHVTSFCCCMSLEAGARVVGFLHLLTSLTLVAVCAYYSHQFGQLSTTDEDDTYGRSFVVSVFVTVVSTVHVLLSGVLLYGAFKRHTGCVRAWTRVMLTLLVLALASVMLSCVRGLRGEGSDIFVSFLGGVLFFCFVLYCIISVNSYYMMMKSREDMIGPKANC